MQRRRSQVVAEETVRQLTDVPPGAPSWVTAELIANTLEVWQPYYDSPLTPADALAMIQAASGLIEVLSTGE